MQHTETLNLNIIQPDDTFSPDPLNENAQALEDALSAEAAARDADVAALDARIVKLEGRHIVTGVYVPTSDKMPMTINLGFTPRAVFAIGNIGTYCGAIMPGYPYSSNAIASIVTGGFQLTRCGSYASGMNTEGIPYIYLALD